VGIVWWLLTLVLSHFDWILYSKFFLSQIISNCSFLVKVHHKFRRGCILTRIFNFRVEFSSFLYVWLFGEISRRGSDLLISQFFSPSAVSTAHHSVGHCCSFMNTYVKIPLNILSKKFLHQISRLHYRLNQTHTSHNLFFSSFSYIGIYRVAQKTHLVLV
jgi:hypothetical protein